MLRISWYWNRANLYIIWNSSRAGKDGKWIFLSWQEFLEGQWRLSQLPIMHLNRQKLKMVKPSHQLQHWGYSHCLWQETFENESTRTHAPVLWKNVISAIIHITSSLVYHPTESNNFEKKNKVELAELFSTVDTVVIKPIQATLLIY